MVFDTHCKPILSENVTVSSQEDSLSVKKNSFRITVFISNQGQAPSLKVACIFKIFMG